MLKHDLRRNLERVRSGRKWRLHELNEWKLAVVGGISFLIAAYWAKKIADVLPELVKTTDQHGLSFEVAAVFVILGGLGVTVWLYGCVAARCHQLLFDRLFQ